jgi:hypothetical protein
MDNRGPAVRDRPGGRVCLHTPLAGASLAGPRNGPDLLEFLRLDDVFSKDFQLGDGQVAMYPIGAWDDSAVGATQTTDKAMPDSSSGAHRPRYDLVPFFDRWSNVEPSKSFYRCQAPSSLAPCGWSWSATRRDRLRGMLAMGYASIWAHPCPAKTLTGGDVLHESDEVLLQGPSICS